MSKEIRAFCKTETENCKFHHCKNLIFSEDADTDNIQMPSIVSSGEKKNKYFIGCKDDDYKIKRTQRNSNTLKKKMRWVDILLMT